MNHLTEHEVSQITSDSFYAVWLSKVTTAKIIDHSSSWHVVEAKLACERGVLG